MIFFFTFCCQWFNTNCSPKGAPQCIHHNLPVLPENGLSYLYAWQPWDRVEAFGWDDDKPNTLILKVLPRSIFSRKYVTINNPDAQKEAVDQLIDDYISEADLATEMDNA